jgi:hypothetical protein
MGELGVCLVLWGASCPVGSCTIAPLQPGGQLQGEPLLSGLPRRSLSQRQAAWAYLEVRK